MSVHNPSPVAKVFGKKKNQIIRSANATIKIEKKYRFYRK